MNDVDIFTKKRFADIVGIDLDKADDIFDYLEKEGMLVNNETPTEEDLINTHDEAYNDGYRDAEDEYKDLVEDLTEDVLHAIKNHSVIIDGVKHVPTEVIERVL